MLDTVLHYCRKEKLIEKGDCVLAGVSGGADSVCLLLLLDKLQEQLEFSLRVVHVEHGIRGKESEADAVFVKYLCEERNVPLHTYHVEALRVAKDQKLGIEEAARSLRYNCYAKAAKELTGGDRGKVKIALAHHADDNAETILFQMIRGSGIDGLCGMQSKRELENGVEVIRPLLCVTRAEIEAYLKETGQVYCIDSTNTDVTYSRNRIRRKVLPILRETNAQAVAHINQSAALLRELRDYLKEQVAIHAQSTLLEKEEGICVLEEPFLVLPPILKKELLHLALVRAAGAAKDIGSSHVCLIEELFSLQVGKSISLPYRVVAKRIYEGVLLKKVTARECGTEFCIEVDELEIQETLMTGGYTIEVPGGSLQISLLEMKGQPEEILKKTYTKYLDYDKIKGSFQIRTRRQGDYLVIDDAGHKKSLKEYFINEKIPAERRDEVLLLAKDEKVLWVVGGRISAETKVSNQTGRILKVQITGGNYHESESDS